MNPFEPEKTPLDRGQAHANSASDEPVGNLTSEDEEYETITVQFTVNTKIPKNKLWTLEQRNDIAKYLATYSTRCVGEFQQMDWGCGSFMTQTFQDPKNPDVIRAHVTAIDKHLVYSTDDYTKEEFIKQFGIESFIGLKRGWPRKHASTLHDCLVKFDRLEPSEPTVPEPKIQELVEL